MRRGEREEGAAAVEFALLATMLFLIVFAAIDVGLWAFAKSQASSAARDASRAAMINPGPPGTYTGASVLTPVTQSIYDEAKKHLGALPPGFTIDISCSPDATCATVDGTNTVTVQVSWHRDSLSFVMDPVVGNNCFGTNNVCASSTRTLLGIPQ